MKTLMQKMILIGAVGLIFAGAVGGVACDSGNSTPSGKGSTDGSAANSA